MDAEESHAYAVIAKRFGCSPTYIKALLETHFEAPSDAGWEHMKQEYAAIQREDTQIGTKTWSSKELRRFLAHLDKLRESGILPPFTRYISIDVVKQKKEWQVLRCHRRAASTRACYAEPRFH